MIMMRLFFVFIGFASLVRAQTAPSSQATPEPLAPGPLLDRAPAFSQWLVSVKAGAPDAPDQKTKYDQRTRVRKTGPIRYEITLNADGHRYEKWCRGNLQANVIPGVDNPEVSMGSSASYGNAGFTDYTKSDFPGFDWISKGNYVGTQTMEGVRCIVFHSGPTGGAATSPVGAPAPNAKIPTTGKTAYITADRRLPVLLDVNGDITFYQFEAPPTAPLALPANVQFAFDNLTSRLQQSAAKPAAP
jgi:hypothetical protein